jgi:hypothetical protein
MLPGPRFQPPSLWSKAKRSNHCLKGFSRFLMSYDRKNNATNEVLQPLIDG